MRRSAGGVRPGSEGFTVGWGKKGGGAVTSTASLTRMDDDEQ